MKLSVFLFSFYFSPSFFYFSLTTFCLPSCNALSSLLRLKSTIKYDSLIPLVFNISTYSPSSSSLSLISSSYSLSAYRSCTELS